MTEVRGPALLDSGVGFDRMPANRRLLMKIPLFPWPSFDPSTVINGQMFTHVTGHACMHSLHAAPAFLRHFFTGEKEFALSLHSFPVPRRPSRPQHKLSARPHAPSLEQTEEQNAHMKWAFCFRQGIESPEIWLREQDLNLRPLGYEPNELPGCSIARQDGIIAYSAAGSARSAAASRQLRDDRPVRPAPSARCRRRGSPSSGCACSRPDAPGSAGRVRQTA